MNTSNTLLRSTLKLVASFALTASAQLSFAGPVPATLDDFSDSQKSSQGIDRLYLDDTTAGGQTTASHAIADGILSAQGDIAPPRGQPGWASAIFLLDPQGRPTDASAYEGIRLVIRINKGHLSVSANSSEVTNFDYHAATLTRQRDGGFHEVKIPFSTMKRAWSEQTSLDLRTIASLSIVAFDMQKGSFDYEVDEIGFY